MIKIEANWEEIAKSLRLTGQLLRSWGYSWQTLVSNYAVIPLAYYIHQKGNPANFITSSQYISDRDMMRRWLQIALLKRTFSGQPDNVLRPVRRVIQDNHEQFPFTHILDDLKTTSKAMKFDPAEVDGLLSYRYGQSYTFTVLSLLYTWLKYDQQFHIDHIFPRSMFNENELRKRNIPHDQWYLWLDQVNDLGNLQLLQGQVNMSKSDQEFENWIRGECSTPQDLTAYKQLHLIPDVSLKFEDFPLFLEAREKILREKLADLFNIQLPENGL
jgi:hypothetical protein